MATKQSKEKIDYSYQVWDTYPHKLLLYVLSAKDVAAKDSNGKSDPYVVIEHGKYKKQTKIIDKTLNPVWNELFFIQADPTVQVKLEMWDHDKIGSPDYMGHVTLDLKAIPQDRIVDISPSLLARKKKETVSGTIHLRIYHSSARETRPHAWHAHGHAAQGHPDLASFQFFYRPFKNVFKPGDLIGYSGYGLVAGVQKIVTCNPITSVGMVLYLPNKWTGDTEPYVIEMTRNVNKNIDVYNETNTRSGIYIFHLFERFHQFYGSDLVHFPLIHPLPSDMYKKVVEKIWDCHKKNAFLDEGHESYKYGPFLPVLNAFIRKKKNWNFEKTERIVEAASFDFVVRILKDCGAHNTEYQDPSDILKSNLFSPPVLLRQVPGETPLYLHSYHIQPPGAGTPAMPVPQMPAHPSYSALPVYTSSRSLSPSSPPQSPPSPYASISTSPPLQASPSLPSFPSQQQLPKPPVNLSRLEMNMMTTLLDGMVLDDQLIVTKQEFRQRMVAKGISVFKDEARFDAFYAVLDSDGDGKVDLRELVCGLSLFIDGSVDEKLLVAFQVFDKDGDKFIKKSELRALLSIMLKTANKDPTKSNSNVVEDFVTQIFAEYDKNNDGKLSLEEFLNAAHSNPAVGNLFLTVSSFT